ncbi:MAG: hypothetical protein KDJ77_03870 [Rhodobiaceae bacterium]|nr:hypothetical protein [Rhodobiaceae bacterium]
MAEGAPVESYRGFVNSWECDENDHLNVQGYAHRFEIAARHAYARAGGRWDAARLERRHVRYLQECGEGDLIRVETATRAGTDDQIFHLLRDADTGTLLATALDTVATPPPAGLAVAEPPEEVLPRGISGEADTETRDEQALVAAGYGLTYTGIVAPQHCGPEGTLDDQHFIARVSDAVAHIWSRAGFTKAVLDAAGAGRVAVEMKITIERRPPQGALLHVVSGVTAVSRSTLQFRHVFFETESGRPFATLNVISLIMDLSARRAIRFSDAERQQAEAALVRD